MSALGRLTGRPSVDSAADALIGRIDQFSDVADLGTECLPDALLGRVTDTVESARARLGHGTSHTVVALAGATGSGKSSLFNALVGTELATVGVRRPTTSVARAAVFADGAEPLLDWLEIGQRHRIDTEHESLRGLVLLDLPDHDSTAAAHRAEVERLVAVVDVFCWVVDPQKYADAALHDEFIQRFAGHGAVTVVALNQIDRLAPDQRRECLAHLAKLLAEDGLESVRVLPTSATTLEGVDDLRRELAARTAERRAVVQRLDADLDWLATDLFAACGDASPAPVSRAARDAMVDAATTASGVDAVADAVGAAYRHRAAVGAGWPPARWVKRFRSDPLRRLGLGRPAAPASLESDAPTTIRRTALPPIGSAAAAAVASAGRDLVADVSDGLPTMWRDHLAEVVSGGVAALPDQLDRTIGSQELPVGRARWWTVVAALQRLLTAALVIGLLWLAVLFVLAWFKIPDPPLPKFRDIPLPTLLVLGGGGLGLLLAIVVRRIAAIGGERRRKQARAALRASVAETVETAIIGPLDAALDRLALLSEAVRKLPR